MLNPEIKIAKSKGIDLPVMYVYLAGRIAGNCIDKCLKWRQDIVEHYKNYKLVPKPEYINGNPSGAPLLPDQYEVVSYPIAFIDPLNSGEATSVDKLGLTSNIPSNLIYDKDLLSVERADVIVANVEDYFEVDIEDILYPNLDNMYSGEVLMEMVERLREKILNRRENFGTICEIAWALYLKKPLILIVPESRKEIYIKHPFAKRASVIVTSSEQLLKEKWLQILYKSISGATY